MGLKKVLHSLAKIKKMVRVVSYRPRTHVFIFSSALMVSADPIHLFSPESLKASFTNGIYVNTIVETCVHTYI